MTKAKTDTLSKYLELTPEEKLLYAIFGQPIEIKHFLTAEGRQAVRDILNQTGEKSARVIYLRFGFEPRTDEEKVRRPSSDCRTLNEVGIYFGVGRERIRQIEAKTLRLLRHPRYSRLLKALLQEV